jgi:excisionase family DNA binding protein
VVQKILRHTDPALTTEIYGHLDLDDMRAGINRLAFTPTEPKAPVVPLHRVASAEIAPLGGPVVDGTENPKNKGRNPESNPSKLRPSRWSGRQDSNLRPLGPESTPDETPEGANPSQSTPFRRDSGGFRRAVGAPNSNPLPSAALIPAPNVDGRVDGFRALSGGLGSLLSVREVALRLSVSTATVYALVGQGKLPCVRVSNAIRVRPEDLAVYLKR